MPQPLPDFDDNSPGRTFLSVIPVITAVLVVLSPCPTVYRIWTNSTVGELSVVPYLSLFVSALSWMLYGIVIKDITVMAPNLIGCVASIGYTTIYHNIALGGKKEDVPSPLVFGITKGQSPEFFRKRLIGYYFLTCIVTIALILLTTLIKDQDDKSKATSTAALVLYFSFLISPFVTIIKVLRTKSVESLPFDLSFMLLINGTVWIIYGYVIANSLTLKVANFGGVISASLQLLCHFIYGRPLWSLSRLFCCCFHFDNKLAFHKHKPSDGEHEHTSVEAESQASNNKINIADNHERDIEQQSTLHEENGSVRTDIKENNSYDSIAIN